MIVSVRIMFIMQATLLLYVKKKYNQSEGEREREKEGVICYNSNHNRTIAIRHRCKRRTDLFRTC